jgi:hypothetical protein
MRRHRPRVVVDDCVDFEQRDGVALLRHRQRGNDSDRTGAGDDDANLMHLTVSPNVFQLIVFSPKLRSDSRETD